MGKYNNIQFDSYLSCSYFGNVEFDDLTYDERGGTVFVVLSSLGIGVL